MPKLPESQGNNGKSALNVPLAAGLLSLRRGFSGFIVKRAKKALKPGRYFK
jgi:hypothetical protein